VDRGHFGTWGLGLSSADFARAIASAGVLAGASGLAGRGALAGTVMGASAARPKGAITPRKDLGYLLDRQREAGRPASWTMPSAAALRGTDARSLSFVWTEAQRFGPIRLEVRLDRTNEDSVPWLVRTLGDDAVGAALYVRWETSDPHRGWHWPLRIGVPRETTGLRAALESVHWNANLFDVVDIEETDAVDLLLLPWSARPAVAHVLGLRRSVRAGCAVLLDGIGSTWGRSRAHLSALQTETRAAAIAAVRVPPDAITDWWRYVVEALAHDQTLDVAFAGASRGSKLPYPVLLASPEFIASTRLQAVVRRMGAHLERSAATAEVALPPQAAHRLKMSRGTPSAIGRNLRRAAPKLDYSSESDAASAVAELARDGVTSAAEAAPREPETRRVQLNVAELSDDTRTAERVQRLRPGRSYAIDVFIADPERGSVVASAIFDSTTLPRSEEGHELVVVFSEPRLAPDPQVRLIHLPAAGKSNSCRFHLRTAETGGRVEARIIVLFANRVLQTLLFRATVSDNAGTFALDVEAAVRPDLSDLDERSRFDAAIVLNHTDAGAASATVVAGGSADLRFPQGLEQAAEMIRNKLTLFATSEQAMDGLRGERMRELLVFLATQGSLLYEALVQGNSALNDARRIQILTARPEAYIPIELLYDRPSPDFQAKLCDGAEEALRTGTCPAGCAQLTTARASVVCPLGFWCLSRVLERHAQSPDAEPVHDLLLRWGSEPNAGRHTLSLSGSLFAASANVDVVVHGGTTTVADALSAGTPPFKRAKTWIEWCDDIKQRPGLLVLLPHTYEDKTLNVQGLEIEEKEDLLLSYLDVQHVRPDGTQPGPLVLLLGCETGVHWIAYQSFVVRLRSRGASIVVSTVSSVLGRHAAPTAVALVAELLKQRAANGGLGDVMLAVRRQLVRDAIPMVLALSSYGDADWRLN
jgi:hypothetical protein